MTKFKSILDRVENIIISLCAILLSVIILVIFYQVVVRKLNIATSGTEELARYCYVLFVFLLWPIAARRGEDLRITVLFDVLPARVRKIVMGFFQIFMAGFSGVCIYSIYLNISNTMKNNVALPSNTWLQLSWIYAIIFLALILTFLANLLRATMLLAGNEAVPTQKELTDQELAAEKVKSAASVTKEGASK